MASPVDTSVKYVHSGMQGIPVLNGVAGSLLDVWDAVAVNGFGLKSVDGGGTISNGTCRLPFSSGVSAAEPNTVILVAGATPSALNGEQKVTAVSNAWVEFATDLPDGAVTGTVTFKMAPLGWEKVFSKTNVAVYRPTDPASTRFYLRIDDTGTTAARVTAYESMTDVDTGFNMMPAASVVNGGYYWWKRGVSGATAVQYAFFGDARAAYYCPRPSADVANVAAVTAYLAHFAGDIKSSRSGDSFCACLTGATGSTSGGSGVSSMFSSHNSSNGSSILRRAHGVGGSVSAYRSAFNSSVTSGDSSAPLGGLNVSVDSTVRTTPVLIFDGDTRADGVRGESPGALFCLTANVTTLFETAGLRQVELAGRHVISLPSASNHDTATGIGFVDITGPWR